MSDPGTAAVVTVLGRRGDAHWARARASLAQGRHAEALEAVRRARRLRSADSLSSPTWPRASACCAGTASGSRAASGAAPRRCAARRRTRASR